jgi:hypothetical protein
VVQELIFSRHTLFWAAGHCSNSAVSPTVPWFLGRFERAEAVANSGVHSAESLKRRSILTLEISLALDCFGSLANTAARRLRSADSGQINPVERLAYGLGSPLGLPDEPLLCGGKGLPFSTTSPSNRPMACPFLTCIIVTVT